MRLEVTRRTVVLSATAVLLGMLAACSTGGTPSPAATSEKPVAPTTAATYNPLAGPIEPAAQLPKSCSKILGDTDLTTAFGSPQVGDTSYGNYAALPNIGRTGRVTCGFVIGVDPFGHPQPAGVTVSIITYNTAVNAANRVSGDIRGTVATGATAQPILVAGHPATILVEPATPPSRSASAPAPSPSATAPSSPAAQPAPSASATASGGNTELLMADGNRTFVVTIPMSKLSGSAAVTTLVSIMKLVYQHTLPTPGSSAPSQSAPASATASPKPSAT